MNILTWLKFFAALQPELKALAKSLYRAFDGDVDKARDSLRRIRDHGERLFTAEVEFERRLAALEASKNRPE